MRAIVLAALVCVTIGNARAFFGYDAYRDARNNYHEMVTNCEREGGECINVDFGGPDPTQTPEPTPPPTMPTTEAPPTRLVPVYIPVYQTTRAPRVVTRSPRVITRAPRLVYKYPPPRTAAPRLFQQVPIKVFNAAPAPTKSKPKPVTITPKRMTQAPKITTNAPKTKDSKRPPKNPKARKAWLRRNPEYEGIERRKRAVPWGPEPFDYLYNECTSGWEFDLGCAAKGMNVCCYQSNNGY